MSITWGVAQGSDLGLILFLLYINDLPKVTKILQFFLFADDTNIYLESTDIRSLEQIMNKELRKLYQWLCINRLSLNITKTNFIIFHAINKPILPVTILINNKAIEEVEHNKYLGVIIDSKLNFKKHIAELTKKISRSIGMLYILIPYITPQLLTNVYYALVHLFNPVN